MSKRGLVGFWLASMLLALMPGCSPSKDEGGRLKYYVQLVRGNDSERAPSTEARPIGPKLSQQLHMVFKWQSYWEMHRETISLNPGEKTKVRLSKEREVEIDLTQAGNRRVTAFENGDALSSVARPVGEPMTIIGGDRDPKSVWFIVVRRDPPPD